MYSGNGVQQLGGVLTCRTFDNVPVTAVAITDTNFHALAGP